MSEKINDYFKSKELFLYTKTAVEWSQSSDISPDPISKRKYDIETIENQFKSPTHILELEKFVNSYFDKNKTAIVAVSTLKEIIVYTDNKSKDYKLKISDKTIYSILEKIIGNINKNKPIPSEKEVIWKNKDRWENLNWLNDKDFGIIQGKINEPGFPTNNHGLTYPSQKGSQDKIALHWTLSLSNGYNRILG